MIAPEDLSEAAKRCGRHFARYLYAIRFAESKRVLDIACGAGYGAAKLAEAAAEVVGMDIDEDRLQIARDRFSGPNVSFLSHYLHEPLPEGPFELITCFETLEHVSDPARCASNLAGGLTSDGLAIISVPNGILEAAKGGKRYHPNQFTDESFPALLNAEFEQVELFSQIYQRSLSHYVRKLFGGKHHASNYRFVPGLDVKAKGWTASCHKPRQRR